MPEFKFDVEVHEAANVFPMMTGKAFEQLKQDIKKDGQNEPITYLGGKIIDGRNRYRACKELGIQPEECELDENAIDNPLAWVLSQNLHRRHLHQSQRAMIAAKMATLQIGANQHVSNDTPSSEDAADLLSVSRPTVCRAKHVLEHGCKELIAAVEACEITVSMAEKLCKSCSDKEEQAQLVSDGRKAIKEFLNPTPHKESDLPDTDDEEDVSDDVGDKYEYSIVKSFRHADYRLNTMKKLIEQLDDAEFVALKAIVEARGK